MLRPIRDGGSRSVLAAGAAWMATARDQPMLSAFLPRRLLAGLAALVLLLGSALPARAAFSLPPLPYAADALEPAIDATTMTLHHDGHHGAYVANLNAQIEANPALESISLDALQGQISRFPGAVRNNGGGHWNHSQFWAAMAPEIGRAHV